MGGLIIICLPMLVVLTLYLFYFSISEDGFADRIRGSLILLDGQLFGYSAYLNGALILGGLIGLLYGTYVLKARQRHKLIYRFSLCSLLLVFGYALLSWCGAVTRFSMANTELNLPIPVTAPLVYFYEEPRFIGSESIFYAMVILSKEQTFDCLLDRQKTGVWASNNLGTAPLASWLGGKPKQAEQMYAGHIDEVGRGHVTFYIDRRFKTKDIVYLSYWIW